MTTAQLQEGLRVQHPTFGEGTVKKVGIGMDGLMEAAVEFDQAHIYLHRCGGRTKEGHGWWFHLGNVHRLDIVSEA